MTAARSQLLDAMRAAGLAPSDPSQIGVDGRLCRYDVEGDKAGRRNGWVAGSAFGSWRTGQTVKWCSRDHGARSPAESAAVDVRTNKARRNSARRQRQERAAVRARRLAACANAADPTFAYLQRKGVWPHKARQLGDRLVLPVYDFDRRLWSLQFIGPDGDKKLLRDGRKRGCFIPVDGNLRAKRVLICEGWATGATLAESEPHSLVLAAIDAGNLAPVATTARKRWPHAEIVVCGDADVVGKRKARQAAVDAGALLALPELPAGAEGSDFNDLARADG